MPTIQHCSQGKWYKSRERALRSDADSWEFLQLVWSGLLHCSRIMSREKELKMVRWNKLLHVHCSLLTSWLFNNWPSKTMDGRDVSGTYLCPQPKKRVWIIQPVLAIRPAPVAKKEIPIVQPVPVIRLQPLAQKVHLSLPGQARRRRRCCSATRVKCCECRVLGRCRLCSRYGSILQRPASIRWFRGLTSCFCHSLIYSVCHVTFSIVGSGWIPYQKFSMCTRPWSYSWHLWFIDPVDPILFINWSLVCMASLFPKCYVPHAALGVSGP